MMRNFLLLFFVCVGFGLNAQTTAALDFVNPEIIGSKYRITFRVTRTTGQTWSLGGGNYRFNYPVATLSNPQIVFNAFAAPSFSATTSTGSNTTTGVMSYNPTYASGTAGLSFPVSNQLDVLTVEFDVLNQAGLFNGGTNQLVWRGTSFPQPRLAVTTASPINPVTLTSIVTLVPLPVELTKFTGKANGEANTLRWEIASQSNVSHFEVERSADGVNNFRAVTENVIAAGTTNLKMTYSADDKAPISMGYYRLVSVDKDGTKDYSKVITIDRRDKKFTIVEVAPNPTTDAIRLNFEVKTKGEVSVSLTDALGRVVMTQNQTAVAGNNNLSLDMSSLAAGTYFLSLSDGTNTTVERVVKQ